MGPSDPMAAFTISEPGGFLAAVFEGASDGLCLVAPDGTVLRANRHWLRSTGLFAEQVIGADIFDLFPESRELAREVHGRARRGERVQVPVHRQSILGRETWWDGWVAPVAMAGGTGILITAREVSHLHGIPTTDAEREGREVLRLVIESSPSPVAILDRELRYLAASSSWVRHAGHGADCRGKRIDDLVRDLPERYLAMYRRCLAGAVEQAEEDAVQRADGTVVWLSWRCQPWRDGRGAIGGLLIQAEVLTPRKEAEQARRRAEEAIDRARLQGLGACINEIELVTCPDGSLAYVNDRAVAAYGYSREELEQLNVRRLALPRDVDAATGQLPPEEGVRHRTVHVRRDGSTFPVEVSSRPFLVSGERWVHTVVWDVAERVRTEGRLRESLAAAERTVSELRESLRKERPPGAHDPCPECAKDRE